MSLEEEQGELKDKGDVIKFLSFVLVIVVVLLVIAAARPLIFEEVVPALMGWGEAGETDGVDEELPGVPESTPGQPAAEPEATAVPQETTVPGGSSAPVEESRTPESAATATTTPQIYQVQAGDNLTRIANRFGVSVEAIVQANNLANPNRIAPGDLLLIP